MEAGKSEWLEEKLQAPDRVKVESGDEMLGGFQYRGLKDRRGRWNRDSTRL